MPAMVGSANTGKTLLVPVDRGIRCTSWRWRSCRARTMARLEPSPPREIRVRQPASRNRATATSVSRASLCALCGSRWTRARSGNCAKAREAMRKGSSSTNRSVAPAASAPAAARATKSRLASWVMLVARAARRRTSRPDIGLTQMPMGAFKDPKARCGHRWRYGRRGRGRHRPGAASRRSPSTAASQLPETRCRPRPGPPPK